MYEAWESPEAGRLAVAKRRRGNRNRRSMAAALGAFVLAWFLTSAGALASVDDGRRQGVARYMGEAGFFIGLGVFVAVVAVSLARWFDERRGDYIERQLNSGRTRAVHRAYWVASLLTISVLMGWSVSWLWSPPGLTATEMFATAALGMLALTTALFFMLGPPDRRVAATTEVISESIAAARLAELTPGEARILERLIDLECRVEQLDRSEPQSELSEQTQTLERFTNWADMVAGQAETRGAGGKMSAPRLTGDAAKAVKHRGSHLQIIAAAGSGKTEVVSQRVADLLAEGVPPRAIVAFTFTERAAEETEASDCGSSRGADGCGGARRARRAVRRDDPLVLLPATTAICVALRDVRRARREPVHGAALP